MLPTGLGQRPEGVEVEGRKQVLAEAEALKASTSQSFKQDFKDQTDTCLATPAACVC